MEPNSFTPFDNMTQTRELQMLKTAIPYMKGDQKKQFAILIKYMELQNTIQVFNQEDKVMSMCSVSEDENSTLAMLNDQVKKGGVMASSYVGGLSGAFIPVSEDQGMIDAVSEGALTIEKLEAMTCVCSVGLDMIAIPGDTKATTISGIIADEMAIGMINNKTTAVRLIPVIGKGVGETVEFGGLLGYAPIMPVNQFSCDAFVNRGGRIPAPIHSFKN